MKLSEVKNILEGIDKLQFQLYNGTSVPSHFHVTEVGIITKQFIDCGGTVRNEKVINFQLWSDDDTDHQLAPQKMLNIITLSEKVLAMEDLDIEVEYQSDTIGKYGLEFNGSHFVLTSKQTACLASDACGITPKKVKINLADLQPAVACCTPGGGCC
jgi:hypothetical protein